ncbi:restriction endonuclease [Tannerella sp. oral taxon 808]|nr:restriction endonuclease [Tannerella sp. oral taxon 808]
MLPTFQECMLPTLQMLADGKPRSAKEIRPFIIERFSVTEKEMQIMLPSNQSRLSSNINWARVYLRFAGLIQSPKRGVYIITSDGKSLLASNPEEINVKMLMDYPKFRAWKEGTIGKYDEREMLQNLPSEDISTENIEITPEEQIEGAYRQMRNTLVEDLLEQIAQQTPEFFERLVIRLLVAMGYGGSEEEISEMVVGKTGDEGIDGIIKEDKLGLDSIYIQAKRWDKHQSIGRPEVQKFVGALSGQGATKGIFITTAQFSEKARLFRPQNNIKVALIDGNLLCQHMIDYNIGVSVQNIYEIKRIDSDFFSEE